MDGKLTVVAIDKINLGGPTQMRASLSEEHILELMEVRRKGNYKDPPILFYDGTTYWPGDGHHRVSADKRLGNKRIEAEVREGELRDAILYAIGANKDHGLPRKPEDKRRAVVTLLDDPVWSKWSQAEIARRAGVSDFLVATIKAERATSASFIKKGCAERLARRGTQVYTINTHPGPGRPKFADMDAAKQKEAIKEAEEVCPTCGQPWPKDDD